jgi:hypothetical protein
MEDNIFSNHIYERILYCVVSGEQKTNPTWLFADYFICCKGTLSGPNVHKIKI